MSKLDYNTKYPAVTKNDCYPRTSNGAVVKVDFKIGDLAKVSTKGVGDYDDTTIKFCIRMGYTHTDNIVEKKKSWINYLDTKITGTLNTQGIFSTFKQEIVVTQNKDIDFTTAITKQVEVNALLCNNKGVEVKMGKTYQVGQYFHMCVHSLDTAYFVDQFMNVKCGDRELITNSVSDDKLTDVFHNPTKKGIVMKSVLLASWMGDEEKKVITCTGQVQLYACDENDNDCLLAPLGPARRMQEEQEIRSEGKEVRILEEDITDADAAAAAELFQSPFEMKIYMDTPNNNNNLGSSVPQLSSSALPPPTTGTTGVVLGVEYLVFFIVVISFFW